MELVLKECTIRSWRPDDAESLVTNANNRNVSRQLRDRFPHPYTRADAEAFLGMVIGRVPEGDFAIEVEGVVAGGIGLTWGEDVERYSAEIGYWLGEPFWGRGIMTASVRAASEWAFREHELIRIFAAVYAGNRASARVLEKAGYVYEGCLRRSAVKEGVVLDRLLYAMTQDREPVTT